MVKVMVKVMHISTVKISKMFADSVNIAIVIQYDVASGLSISVFRVDLGLFRVDLGLFRVDLGLFRVDLGLAVLKLFPSCVIVRRCEIDFNFFTAYSPNTLQLCLGSR